MKNKNKEKKFKLFDMNRDGKGVYEAESRKPTLKFFFKLLWRKFSQLLQLNLLMLFQVVPVIIILFVYFSGTKTPTSTDVLYAPLYGIGLTSTSASFASLLDFSSIQMGLPVFSPTIMIILVVLLAFVVITYGWQNVGAAYVLRGLFRGDPVFVFTDFFHGIKRNFKQAFFMGIIDSVFTGVLIADFMFFYNRTGSFGLDFMYFTIFALVLIYIVMKFYIYQLLITFKLSNFKILKNALIFTVLGIKRNIMAILGIVLVIAINVLLIVLLIPYGISIPLVLPFVYIMSLLGFITTYAAYPVIDKYMIEPYKASENEDATEEQ